MVERILYGGRELTRILADLYRLQDPDLRAPLLETLRRLACSDPVKLRREEAMKILNGVEKGLL